MPVGAQQKTTPAKNTPADTVKVDLFNGFRVDIDAVPVISGLLGNKETFSYEAALQAYIKNKYYPVIELGYAGANKTTDAEANFKTNGMFGRIGVDINLIKSKKGVTQTDNMALLGIRFGYSGFKYTLANVIITDDYWDESTVHNYNNIRSRKAWFELSGGMRVEISPNIFMGWTVKYRNLFKKPETGTISPWFVPGFGINTTGTTWGVNYCIGYKFNFKK
ncbi:MAG: hypothetical protein H6Q20_2446 [Bacteroidetes bacterium]|nr:hypothetical protein [Bacteroidota bacterium]